MSGLSNHEPDVPANEIQHVDLWKYFENRGAAVKNTMFNVVTWIVGFAAVILGFIVKETITFVGDSIVFDKPTTLLCLSVIGLLVIVYARIVINDFSDHINKNFDRADRARDTSKSLLEILDIKEKDPERSTGLPNICKYVLRVVWIFGVLFLIGVIIAVIKITT